MQQCNRAFRSPGSGSNTLQARQATCTATLQLTLSNSNSLWAMTEDLQAQWPGWNRAQFCAAEILRTLQRRRCPQGLAAVQQTVLTAAQTAARTVAAAGKGWI